MPEPNVGESESEFMNRCIPVLISEGKSQSQSVLLCNYYYKNKNDAIEGNFSSIRKQVKDTIGLQKEAYRLVFEKYIDEGFNEGVRAVEKELSMGANSLYDFDKTKPVRDILKTNAVSINFELWDSIEKEITLLLTDIELNNIPFTNSGIKKEVRSIFEKKSGRLASQVVTETTRSANQGLSWGYKKSGLITHKQWVAILDNKTSGICRFGNGQIRQIGEPFSTGDYTAPFHINCFGRGTKITTDDGLKNIEDIELGNNVLTHKNRFKPVVDLMENVVDEYYEIEVGRSFYNKKTLRVTGDHPILTSRGWVKAKDLTVDDYVVRLK